MKTVLVYVLLLFGIVAYSQLPEASSQTEISILTIGPGKHLNDSFGHSAIRVKDPKFDIVFNYGTYDFNTPNFYTKFAQGKLNYKIAAEYFYDFESRYIRQNRWIKSQTLNLTPDQNIKFYNYLKHNYKPEHQFYLYDFFYDNCATKIRDVAQQIINNSITFNPPKNLPKLTFRGLINSNLKPNSWGHLGINIALGSVIDQPVPDEDYMFLPNYIYDFFNTATIDNTIPLVKHSELLFKAKEETLSSNFLLSPLFIFTLISLLIVYITYKDYKSQSRSKWLDVSMFTITGIAGTILLLLWFATDHTATAQNYNILWAFPLNLLLIPQLLKGLQPSWVNRFLKFLLIMLCLLVFHWVVGIQVFSVVLIPLLIAIAIRYIYLIKVYLPLK